MNIFYEIYKRLLNGESIDYNYVFNLDNQSEYNILQIFDNLINYSIAKYDDKNSNLILRSPKIIKGKTHPLSKENISYISYNLNEESLTLLTIIFLFSPISEYNLSKILKDDIEYIKSDLKSLKSFKLITIKNNQITCKIKEKDFNSLINHLNIHQFSSFMVEQLSSCSSIDENIRHDIENIISFYKEKNNIYVYRGQCDVRLIYVKKSGEYKEITFTSYYESNIFKVLFIDFIQSKSTFEFIDFFDIKNINFSLLNDLHYYVHDPDDIYLIFPDSEQELKMNTSLVLKDIVNMFYPTSFNFNPLTIKIYEKNFNKLFEQVEGE